MFALSIANTMLTTGEAKNSLDVKKEHSSGENRNYPRSEDVKTLNGIMKAYYEVVSGPAGSIPDKDRDLSIHIKDAQVIMMSGDGKGGVKPNIMTISGYHERNSKPRKTGFFEYEIKRETRKYGAITHVWSTYEWKTTKDGPVGGRGINSIQLFHDGNRYWISAESYDIRNKPVPKEFMP
ncbi:MAG: hypothetical protein HKN33_19185 [Pyrinomonadaceae bacterium]|nr:hypothetical protein [Pyrinomonadaceae bacterium]